MEIINKTNFSYQVDNLLNKLILQAKENPLHNIYIIVDDENYYEEILLNKTDALFNIELTSYQSFLATYLTKQNIYCNLIDDMTLQLNVYDILKNNETIFLDNINFKTIQDIINICKKYDNYDIKDLNLNNIPNLSKEKIQDTFKIYSLILNKLDSNTVLSYEDSCINHVTKSNDTFVFIDYPNYLKATKFIDALASINNVLKLEDQEFDNYDNYNTTLISNLKNAKSVAYSNNHPYHFIKESNMYNEINHVLLDLYQDLVDNNNKANDYCLYYPDNTYLETIIKTLDKLSLPYSYQDSIINRSYQGLLAILDYIITNDNKYLMTLLSYRCLSEYQDHKYLDSIKKHYLETNQIDLDTDFLNIINTIKEDSINNIINTINIIIKDYFITNKETIDLKQYLSHFNSDTNISITALYNLLVKNPLKVTNRIKSSVDSIYLLSYQQPYSSLLGAKVCYMLGNNEGQVPLMYKDTGLLLNSECQVLNIETTYDLQETQNNHLYHILSNPHDKIVFSNCTSSLSGEEIIDSSLISKINSTFDVNQLSDYILTNKLRPLLYLNNLKDETYSTLNNNVDYYISFKNQVPSLKDFKATKDMSASSFEIYNGCPFKYYASKLLGLYTFNKPLLQANEIGSLVHYVNEQVVAKFDEFNKLDLDIFIKTTIETYIQDNLANKLSHPLNQFIIQSINDDLYNVIHVLYYQYDHGSFKNIAREASINSDFESFNLKGFVDRADLSDTYLKVIDYKNASKDINIDLARVGFNIQMLLYLEALAKESKYDLGAVLYFTTKKQILKTDTLINQNINLNDYLKLYQMTGLTVENVAPLIDNDLNENRKSLIINASLKKDGNYTHTSRTISKDDLIQLLTDINKHITALYQKLLTGDISILPASSDNSSIKTNINPCRYCDYKGLCHFDVFYNQEKKIGKEK